MLPVIVYTKIELCDHHNSIMNDDFFLQKFIYDLFKCVLVVIIHSQCVYYTHCICKQCDIFGLRKKSNKSKNSLPHAIKADGLRGIMIQNKKWSKQPNQLNSDFHLTKLKMI